MKKYVTVLLQNIKNLSDLLNTLDGEQMNLFRKLAGRPETKKIQTIEEKEAREVLQYMQSLELPHPQEKIKTELCDGGSLEKRHRQGAKAQWYLLIFGEDGQGAFNAGYVLKQGLEFLHSRRISAKILQQVPEEPGDRQCLGILSIGVKAENSFSSRWEEMDSKYFLISQKREEHWMEDVLTAAGKLLTADMQTGVRVIRRESVIHIAAGSCFGRNRAVSEFHAGVVLGALMMAAEELWIDLDMVNLKDPQQAAGPDYLISICRKKDREMLLTKGQESVPERKRHLQGKPVKEHQWKYA